MDFDKILNKHKTHKKLESSSLYEVYFEAAINLFDEVYDLKKVDDNIKQLAANNLIVNIASAIENYCKNIIISNSGWNEEGFKFLLSNKITLDTAYDIFSKKNITREFLVANNSSFSNFESISTVFDSLTGSKFFKEIERHAVSYELEGKEFTETLIKDRPNWRKNMTEFYDVRNKFIHEGILKKFTPEALVEMVETVHHFQFAMDDYLDAKYDLWFDSIPDKLIIQ